MQDEILRIVKKNNVIICVEILRIIKKLHIFLTMVGLERKLFPECLCSRMQTGEKFSTRLRGSYFLKKG